MSAPLPRALHYVILLIGAFVFAAAFAAEIAKHPFPYDGLDEPAHAAYSDYLARTHRLSPDFDQFPMAPDSAVQNYINHPPTFYLPMAWFGGETPPYRAAAIGLTLLLTAAYYAAGGFWRLSLPGTVLYAGLPFLLSAQYVLGFYNNDLAAILGGLLFCIGSFLTLQQARPRLALFCMVIGILLASVKLTALLLVGFYAVFLYLLARPVLPRRNLCLLLVAGVLAGLPYLCFTYLYGSPAPDTPGQRESLIAIVSTAHWEHLQNLPFIEWLTVALGGFAYVHNGLDLTWVGLALLLVSWCILLLSPQALHTQPAYRCARAGLFATLCMLVCHLYFSHGRYEAYGWVKDFYVRYYFPLLPVYGLTVIIATTRLFRNRAYDPPRQ